MRLAKYEPVKKSKVLYGIFVKRRIKNRFVYVCIAIASGRENAQTICEAINQSANHHRINR